MSYEVIPLKPALDFVGGLNKKMRAKVYKAYKLLKAFGYMLREPHSKKLKGEDNLYELRVKQGSNIVRLPYYFQGNKTYIVTSGYFKKDEKTNRREIERAKRLKEEFENGNK
jgi:phage-related protein